MRKKTNKAKKKYRKSFFAIFVIFLIIILSVFFYVVSSNEKTLVLEVNASDDDSRTFVAGDGYGDEDGQWASLQLSPSYSFGVRFTNVNISQGAIITEAHVELFSIGSPGLRHPNCRIYCDYVDNAVNFSVIGVLDKCGRHYTHHYTTWNATLPYNIWVKSPSLIKPIQEVINRKNWSSGNSIAVLFISNELLGYSASFKNYEMGFSAKLDVTWKETM